MENHSGPQMEISYLWGRTKDHEMDPDLAIGLRVKTLLGPFWDPSLYFLR